MVKWRLRRLAKVYKIVGSNLLSGKSEPLIVNPAENMSFPIRND